MEHESILDTNFDDIVSLSTIIRRLKEDGVNIHNATSDDIMERFPLSRIHAEHALADIHRKLMKGKRFQSDSLISREAAYKPHLKAKNPEPYNWSWGAPMSRPQSSKAVDLVSTQLERLRTEMPREAGRLRNIILRLDRVANTLEAEESVAKRVSQVEDELEGLGVDFTVEPNSAHKEATCIYAYRGQLDPREESSILGRVAQKYGSLFENTARNQPYKITIPHNA